MKIIFNDIFLEHETGMHPETRKRLEMFKGKINSEIESGEEFLEKYHTKEYIQKVKDHSLSGEQLDKDTVISQGSYKAAIYAVGATIKASQTNNFALVRPPGHHAHPDHSSGFCIFNNIAISVNKLVNEGKRVLIFDFDGHHGDGTSKYFSNSNKVMYWSIHQFPAFPGSGKAEDIGEGEGKGYTINVPLCPGSGDDLFIEGIKRFLPYAKKFNPDIVAISAGFDSHTFDLLLDLNISINSYYEVGKIIKNNFDNFYATLEGGYNVEILPKCVSNFLDGCNGKKQEFFEEQTESPILKIEETKQNMDITENKLNEIWSL